MHSFLLIFQEVHTLKIPASTVVHRAVQYFVFVFFFSLLFLICSLVVVDADIFQLLSLMNVSEVICLTVLQALHGLLAVQDR